jgi:hypothetical protein
VGIGDDRHGRLDVDRILVVAVVVEDLGFKPLGVVGQAVAQGAAAGDEPTQRMSASVPQNARLRSRLPVPAFSTTPRQ